jgi:hypothetical protein
MADWIDEEPEIGDTVKFWKANGSPGTFIVTNIKRGDDNRLQARLRKPGTRHEFWMATSELRVHQFNRNVRRAIESESK